MSSFEALSYALALYGNPRLAELIRRSRLPNGMTILLEAAAGEAEALAAGSKATGRSTVSLQKAAGFFILQVLLVENTNSYRTFGAERDASEELLRRHMALILRWLHPDLAGTASSAMRFDHSVFASRVTQAWELIKTSERRASYDKSLAAQKSVRIAESMPHGHAWLGSMAQNRQRRLTVYALRGEGFWSWLRQCLGGRG